tara:strand:- start:92 stop:334 length:243 start_codon:yes stop_codon:yes gene_type:complete
MLKLVQKGINIMVKQGLIKPVTTNSKPKTETTTVKKNNNKKFASIGIKQMRMGNTGTVVTSGGLLTNQKTTIKKKTLLGA